MPSAALRRCSGSPLCPHYQGQCPEHTAAAKERHRRFYTGVPGVNYGRRWKASRSAFLARNPWCVDCEAEGKQVPADEVDHVIPHRGNSALFWDQKNWAGRCRHHHSAKTARESGFYKNHGDR